MKKVLIVSDTHCGSQYGLTPPDWYSKSKAHKALQSKLWEWFADEIKNIGPVDAAIFNGDLVDGEGKKDSTEHITTDMDEQADIAIETLSIIKTKKRYFVYGTPYHVNGSQPYEKAIARHYSAPIKDEMFINVNGLKISARHHGGRSDVPYGQGTQISKEYIRDTLNAEIAKEKAADLVIRSHVHYYYFAQSSTKAGLSTPCLEYPFGTYGHKLRTMYYNMGLLLIEVEDTGEYFIRKRIMPVKLYKKREYIHV